MSRTRVLRVIARLNMGGPAHQAALLSGRRFFRDRYETLLVHGSLPPGEGSLAAEAEDEGAEMVQLPSLVQPVDPRRDAAALRSLVALIRRRRPAIVHTHTAKAGLLGRTAALLAGEPRPRLVHTFHGHVLEGYFGPVKSATFRRLEAALATRTDVLIGVSEATVADLVRLGVAPRSRFRVVPLGLDLDQFAQADAGSGRAVREEFGIEPEAIVCTFAGRFAAIKRLDLLLEAVAIAARREHRIRLLVVGDGESAGELRSRAEALGIAERVSWAGYRRGLAPIWSATDIAVLSSDNEGTPVALIEAGATGVPAVATDVGGVRETLPVEGSILAAAGDAEGLAAGIADLAADRGRRAAAGEAARAYSLRHFSFPTLAERIDDVYRQLEAPS